jgi:bacillithiol synthase
MDCTCIPYTRVPKSSHLLVDYLYHFDRVSPFYNGSPFDPASFKAVAEQLHLADSSRRDLAEILTRQNKSFGSGEPTFENIGRLAQPGTFAVVTGQQVGLLSGPAFTLYKALTAVRLAQSLTEQGLRSVPVFWLATEDHDLEEVAQAAVLDEDYDWVPLRDAGARPAPHSSVGAVQLSDEVGAMLEKLESLLPAGEVRDRLLGDLRECYSPGRRWGEAFGRFMAKLFHRWGVILLDPLDEAIHHLVAPVYERAITHAAELRARLLERSAALLRAGYHAQVHVTEDSTLLFVTRQGNRLPLHQRNHEFLLDDSEKISSRDLSAAAKDQPLSLTSNVLLRPVVQDTLLPTVAYIAGPSELAYFGQAQILYEAFGRPMPPVFPRAAFTLVDRRAHRLLEKYQLSLEDIWQGREHLNRKIAAAGFSEGGAEGWSARFDRSEHDLNVLLERLHQDIEIVDPTLLDSLKHVEEKIKYQMERLRGKISRAALQKSELLARHEETLLRFLTPRKDLQEREVSGAYFLGRAGYDILDRLHAQIQTGSSDHQVVLY